MLRSAPKMIPCGNRFTNKIDIRHFLSCDGIIFQNIISSKPFRIVLTRFAYSALCESSFRRAVLPPQGHRVPSLMAALHEAESDCVVAKVGWDPCARGR